MTVADERRRELALFLRSRRERISPDDVGIRIAGPRRTSGLRREELATQAGVSVTWYTWLEQARRINVSRQILQALSEALHLSEPESKHLFSLARELPPDVEGESTASGQQLRLLEHLDPLPAFVTNQRFDVLAWNYGFSVLFPDFESQEPAEQNSLLMMFTDAAVELYPAWEAETAQAVALFRAHAGHQVVEPHFREVIDRLLARSERFAELWGQQDIVPLTPARREFQHPTLGLIELEYLKFYSGDEKSTLVIHQPLPGSEVGEALSTMVEQARSEADQL